MPPSKLIVLFRSEEESWNAFSRRVRDAEGEAIVVLSSVDNRFLLQEEERKIFFAELGKLRYRVRLATKEPILIRAAKGVGLHVYDKTRSLRHALQEHPQMDEALRFFSPSLWRQHWRSRLQSIGLLSLPKVRIWILIGVSGMVFLFVLFRLLPSATVRIWPREDVVTQTMNVILTRSGGMLSEPSHVRQMPLMVVSSTIKKSIVFKDISPEFIGTDAKASITIVNNLSDDLPLRKDTRLVNQAGMIFRLDEQATIPARGKATVKTTADHIDLYGNVIGDRGNVPANVQWSIPGLSPEDQKKVTAINQRPATGGKTASRKVVQQKDIDIAEKKLRQELLADAKQEVEEKRQAMNTANHGIHLEFLNKQQVIQATYSGIVLPIDQIGKSVDAITVQGILIYSVPAYDSREILASYSKELQAHAGEGKEILQDTVRLDPEKVVIIEFDDNFQWVKLTLDLAANEQFSLDPLTPAGVKFGKRVRDAVVGLSKKQALQVLKNFPEVERVEISVWPPWSTSLPAIPSNIDIEQQD